MLVNFSHALCSHLSTLGDVDFGLAALGLVQSNWVWRSPVLHFMGEFKTTSHI